MDEDDAQAQAQRAAAFEALGGEPQVEALVERFYDLMELDPAYTALRAYMGRTWRRRGKN